MVSKAKTTTVHNLKSESTRMAHLLEIGTHLSSITKSVIDAILLPRWEDFLINLVLLLSLKSEVDLPIQNEIGLLTKYKNKNKYVSLKPLEPYKYLP